MVPTRRASRGAWEDKAYSMALSPRLEVRQSQSLTLTPQLMQSIRLLQLSHLELNAFVDTELLRNPLLEREDGTEPADTLGTDARSRPPRRRRRGR